MELKGSKRSQVDGFGAGFLQKSQARCQLGLQSLSNWLGLQYPLSTTHMNMVVKLVLVVGKRLYMLKCPLKIFFKKFRSFLLML